MKEQKGVTIMKCLQHKNKETMRNEKENHYFICSPFNELLCFDNNYSSVKYFSMRYSRVSTLFTGEKVENFDTQRFFKASNKYYVIF